MHDLDLSKYNYYYLIMSKRFTEMVPMVYAKFIQVMFNFIIKKPKEDT